MSTEPLTPEDDALAAEYALSLLEGAERAEVEARLAREPALAAAVARWQAAFAELAEEVAPVPVPERVRRRLEARLFAPPPGARTAAGPGWLRWLSGVAVSGAVVVALFLVAPLPGLRFAPAFTAELQAEDSALDILASYDPGRGELRVERRAGGPPAGRVLQLWALAGDAAPVSLGLLESEATRLVLPPELAPVAGELTLAVSEEPPGGSPTGLPTGQVLAAAPVQPL
ncbi:anti-sigma factor [Histidinibacterium lentulum]|uniref:Regulator of SigK n=1 Tax=Histidinibacterium lentulum TaxID=2480588 RepID=A0A3N2QVC9_9RHOB|nr:anti-sigma factor [Histidinibacterium lentulum]ROT99120.1 hypothetical protein EAT49_15435 [Histidinibacterium lentulum]